jgi:putative redox protein
MKENQELSRMRASARREGNTLRHTVQVREHELLAVSLASCTAITMEMYAARKGWDIGHVEVDVEYSPAERGCPTKFQLVMRLPDDLPEDQVERLRAIAAKCPVHRALDGEVMFQERIERVHLAA